MLLPTATPPTAITTPPPSPAMAANLRKCNIEYQKLGCFVDKQPKTSTLALPEKMLNEVVNWDQWNVWLPDFVCRCANLVYENNYNVFGIHLFGECWSGVKAGDTYNMYGTAEECLDTNQQQCGVQSVRECSGDQNSNFVYRIIISQGAQVEPSPVPETAKKRHGLKENCLVDFIKRGCVNDLQSRRPLPQLMFTDLDINNAKFSGFPVDWGSWNSYMDDVVCRCAEISRSKGFDYFGLGNFGECWSGKGAQKTYDKENTSPFCITKEFAECNAEDEHVCSGNKTTAFIYSVKENHNPKKEKDCFTQFQNVGCYEDKQISPRPIPELIFTDMDINSPKYSGKKVQLGELDTYIDDVLCRCAERSQKLGYEYFGVQNHGECFSGNNVEQSYSKDGSSKQCITRDFQQCPEIKPSSKETQQDCIGVQGSNYVYRIRNLAKENKMDAEKLHLGK